MSVIKSNLNTADEAFQLNREAMKEKLVELFKLRHSQKQGGPESVRKRHQDRGRMLPRDRVEALLDPGAPFLELGELAGLDQYDDVPPGASLITGIGVVSGRLCMIIANDSTVKGGTYFGLTCKKHVRAQKIAWNNRLPVITLVDSGGAFLPDMANIFPDEGQFGSIFHHQVGMSGDDIPQIAVVMGPCTAGGAYIPALCDEVVIVRGQGFMYLGGPELTYAATGEQVDAETLGGAKMHCSISGVTDHIAENDAHALSITRDIVGHLGEAPTSRKTRDESRAPLYPEEEIYGIVSRDAKIPTDNREILARLVDGSEFHEFKPQYGDTLMTGFARIHGHEIGILANDGVLFTESANKAAHFINLCCQRDIPLLFLVDVTGFMVGREAEQAGIAKAGAKMITAMSSARVPKYTVITGGSYGAGYLSMLGRAFQPDAMFMWPSGRSAIMGPEQAASVLAQVRTKINEREGKTWTAEEEEEFKKPVRKIYEDFQTAYNFASNLWVDGVIDPLETRDVMALLLDVAARRPKVETNFGVFRF
ncbi:methylcrotonoyl-CoA carboxylase [Sneathiella sp. P13V-1]|uniref:carboxyl transferase domain-containing protein n=1 Tax=Sneathiella sp. P13V-1 TaxID=2697366 RepID=UPI00187BC2A6|nr:carboxyl transferase domain-containing protein [Sneathiella sp. P13V-1]MBE7637484.1 methylcrotonoyl-CoA carboxylase [Sneathiella sp. P13V-1]